MKKIFSLIASGALLLCACEEFQPVFTLKYEEPLPYEYEEVQANISIADLAKLYTHGSPIADMSADASTLGKIIAGRVSTSDQPGNFYKTLYIQDATGGMEIKIGKNGLYNFYKPGQMIYVKCDDLALGEYGAKYNKNSGALTGSGMVQIGFNGEGTKYETSYIEMQNIIDEHIIPGDPEDIVPVEPEPLTESQLPNPTSTLADCPYIGKIVTLKGLRYGGVNSYKDQQEAFALLYIDAAVDGKTSANRIFVSGVDTGLETWGLSQLEMDRMLTSGIWDGIDVGNSGDYNYGHVGDKQYKRLYLLDRSEDLEAQEEAIEVLQKAVPANCVSGINTAYLDVYDTDGKTVGEETVTLNGGGEVTLKYVDSYPAVNRSAASVSQYFTMGSTLLAIRTSGYCKFADTKVPEEVLNGSKTIEVTGVLTLYEGSIQITVNDITDIKVEQ